MCEVGICVCKHPIYEPSIIPLSSVFPTDSQFFQRGLLNSLFPHWFKKLLSTHWIIICNRRSLYSIWLHWSSLLFSLSLPLKDEGHGEFVNIFSPLTYVNGWKAYANTHKQTLCTSHLLSKSWAPISAHSSAFSGLLLGFRGPWVLIVALGDISGFAVLWPHLDYVLWIILG